VQIDDKDPENLMNTNSVSINASDACESIDKRRPEALVMSVGKHSFDVMASDSILPD
jgi:hypothetical protein